MNRNSEKPLIGIPTSETLAEQVLAGDLELSDIGLTREKIDRAHDLPRVVRQHVEDALAGKDDAMVERCLAKARLAERQISLEYLAVLAHSKANAAAWLAIQNHLDHILTPPGYGANIMSVDIADPMIDPHVHFGNLYYRMPGGMLDVPRNTIPATLMIAAVGKPLSAIFSHPALNGFNHVITSVDEIAGSIEIEYGDYHPTIWLSNLSRDLMWPNENAVKNIHELARGLHNTAREGIDTLMTRTPA